MSQHVLVTGGAGFIGSHTVVQLVNAGHQVTILDNLSNSSIIALERIKKLCTGPLDFIEGDIRNPSLLEKLFSDHDITAVIHFAGLKAVGESVEKPLEYYENNVGGTTQLLKAMQHAGVKTFIFSSSATVYGDPETLPITEDSPRSTTNPYGQTKLMCEHILEDLDQTQDGWKIILLRYFNPVGAHISGTIGESPAGTPNNLMPFVSQVASGRRDTLSVFGNDYPTKDGTGVRDYIHVEDLAEGHLAALNYLLEQPDNTLQAINLGTGKGISVLELVNAFEQASGQQIPYQISPRRSGDIATCYADATRAKSLLGWQATKTVEDMCNDTWRWQSQNPNGYDA